MSPTRFRITDRDALRNERVFSAMEYNTRERIFIFDSLLDRPIEAVFATDDLSDEECRALAASVHSRIFELHPERSWSFRLAPSAHEDPTGFINLKSCWEKFKIRLEEFRANTLNSRQANLVLMHDIASERAKTIHQMRSSLTATNRGGTDEVKVSILQGPQGKLAQCNGLLKLELIAACESLIKGYSDPRNYWRNV